jgi:hypothetical protein
MRTSPPRKVRFQVEASIYNVHRLNQLLETALLEERHLRNALIDLQVEIRELQKYLSERGFKDPEMPRNGWQDALDQG